MTEIREKLFLIWVRCNDIEIFIPEEKIMHLRKLILKELCNPEPSLSEIQEYIYKMHTPVMLGTSTSYLLG